MDSRSVVLAVFASEASADAAVKSLKAWDGTDDAIDLDAVGILVLDDAGRVKMHKVGSRSSLKGAGVGTILALLTPVGLAAGVVGGAVAGALHHKGLGLSDGARQRLANDLRDGKAAVGVLAGERERDAVSAKLAELGGAPETYPLDEAELAQAAAETAEMFGETPAGDAGAGVGASREELEIPASVMQD